MSRPLGVTVIAALVLGFSGLTLYRALDHPGTGRGRSILIVAVLLGALALVTAQALWGLRGHAFLMFTIWAMCAMVALVMLRLSGSAGPQAVRLLPPIVYIGLVFGVAALYLRRAV